MKVFSAKLGGGWYLLAVTSASNLQKFFPRKFSSLEVSRYAVLNRVWVHYTQNSKKIVSFPNPQYGTCTQEIIGQWTNQIVPPKFISTQNFCTIFTRPSSLLTAGLGTRLARRGRLIDYVYMCLASRGDRHGVSNQHIKHYLFIKMVICLIQRRQAHMKRFPPLNKSHPQIVVVRKWAAKNGSRGVWSKKYDIAFSWKWSFVQYSNPTWDFPRIPYCKQQKARQGAWEWV